MKKILEKIRMWWYFHVANPVVRKGEHGGFKWEFRRFWLEISTVSGNFKARFIADEHPYAYLLAGKEDNNIIGFCQMIYMLSKLITTDQGLVNDLARVLVKYDKRLSKSAKTVEDELEEKMALESEKAIQEHIELPDKERRKVEKDIDRRFKKAVKKSSKALAQDLKEK